MAISDQQSLQKFPFPYDLVWEHILKVLLQEGFSLEEEDKLIGRIVATSGMSVVSWGENLSISLDAIDESTTSVNIICGLKVGFNLAANYKNQKNIDKLYMALSKSLQKPADVPRVIDPGSLEYQQKLEEDAYNLKAKNIVMTLVIIAIICFIFFVMNTSADKVIN